ncbi:hypothetical protein ACH4S8_37925 [Streptomyces sp. NPDC021080]|uniref:hypothetical protein n=1 Tax=Streptomyces sp. NPDC021080 TaxID=3365110 RepID=UPI0037A62F40
MESLFAHGRTVLCEKRADHVGVKMPDARWHEGPGGVRWPAAPRFSFLPNDGPRWTGPDSGFDMIGSLDEEPVPCGPTVRAMLLACALVSAEADPDGTPESWGTAAVMRERFASGTPRLSPDETRAFADLVYLHAISDYREIALRALGYLSAVSGIPGRQCDRCVRRLHHRGACRA